MPDLELELDIGTNDEALGAPDGPPPLLPADPLGFGFPDPPCADDEEPLIIVWGGPWFHTGTAASPRRVVRNGFLRVPTSIGGGDEIRLRESP